MPQGRVYTTTPSPPGLTDRVVAALDGRPMTRDELSSHLGISRTSLARVLTPMVEEGSVVVDRDEGNEHPAGRGRRPERLRLPRGSARCIGIDVSRAASRAVALDPSGHIVAGASRDHGPDQDWPAHVEALCQELEECAARREVDLGEIEGVGLGMPIFGTTPVSDHALDPRLLPAVIRSLRDRWGAPVVHESTVRVAALAEARWGAGLRADNMLFVRSAAGVGGAVVLGGRLAGGHSGRAGEIGHLRVPGATEACQCGQTGCLETVASLPAVCRAANQPDVAGLVRAHDRQDPSADAALQAAADALGWASACVVLLLDPGLVVLDGPLAHEVSGFTAMVTRALHRELVTGAQWPTEVVAARCQGWDPARAAASLSSAATPTGSGPTETQTISPHGGQYQPDPTSTPTLE